MMNVATSARLAAAMAWSAGLRALQMNEPGHRSPRQPFRKRWHRRRRTFDDNLVRSHRYIESQLIGCCICAIAGRALEHDVPIPTHSVTTNTDRTYRKASDVVNEVIEARMLIGVHFRTANEDGADIGRKIAKQIRSRWFKRS